MSKTISDNYTTTKDFFIKDAYRFVPGLSDKDLGTASSSSEKWMTFRTAFDAVEKSVSLGTAFDIAGRDLANPASMKSAIKMAIKMATTKKAYELAHAD